ncbi:MAG: leucine-rich repeat domain-containing protein [Ruminococcus sp.]|nr:leucine-rich repeat domain-containing protein [Ruminococcus sp.]
MENFEILADAVLTRSPEEVGALYKRLGHVENSARALGLACRFRGLEYVKVLTENGADFIYTRPDDAGGYFTVFYWLAPLEMTAALRRAYFVNSDPCFTDHIELTENGKVVKTLRALPIEQRAEIARYLYENRRRVRLDAGELLFYSIISNTKEVTAALRESGAAFSEGRIAALTEKGRSYEWLEFCNMMGGMDDDEFLEIMRNIVEEVGGKTLHYTGSVYWENCNPYRERFRFFRPDIFRFILGNFNQKKMNKTQLMKGAIDQNSVKCLEMCAENGWLKMPRKRDEMIQYSSDKGMTECTAWLLDFKNRTADLAAEQARAEKKMLAELNADPNSVTVLKKTWGFEKLEDGTLMITGYKGKRTEVEVPSVIGKNTVTAIGAYAFSPGAPRLRKEQRVFRRKELAKVVLPDTVTSIGDCAFDNCQSLTAVNIPGGVTALGKRVFSGCLELAEIKIPSLVRTIGESAFSSCVKVEEIVIPEGVTEIGDYMFNVCVSLKSVVLPGTIGKIGVLAFYNCMSLGEIVIPEGVTEIGRQAFMRCAALKSVVLPASVKKIKNYKYRDRAPEHIFTGLTGVCAAVEPKSYAEKYCRRYEIPFKYKESI